MSLDFDLECEILTGCVESKPEFISVFTSNITHNVREIWIKAGVYEALYEYHGNMAREIIDTLAAGLSEMENNSEEYRKLNPSNGWGSYESAYDFLKDVLRACKRYPAARIVISR